MFSTNTNSYDQVPYESHPFPQTHPDRLATLGRIFGLSPCPVTRCRVLELGCASGGNLIPMAFNLSESEFIGVDLSRKQVDMGRETINALGLTNIRIQHASILDVTDEWGEFDYIICHGVFSWVEREVQDKILSIAARNLSPHGIAYISYNTYPGWHLREMIREMMRYHVAQFDESAEQIEQARALLDFLVASVAPDSGAYSHVLNSELGLLRKCEDWYIYHEHLERANSPAYFHEFIERAERVGLQYLAEAELSVMLASRFSPQVAEILERISPDILHLEQYMDFIRNRHFRQTLLCLKAQRPRRALDPRVLKGLLMAMASQTEADSPDPSLGHKTIFRQEGHSIETDRPATKAAFAILLERFPHAMDVGRLCDEALDRAAHYIPLDANMESRLALEQDLFQAFLSGFIRLQTWQPDCVNFPSEAPLADALAQYQAKTQSRVVNARHETVGLDALSREVLRLSTGKRNRGEILEQLIGRALDGGLSVRVEDEEIKDRDMLQTILARGLEESLASLTNNALLSG